jgi:hypothetical protein
MTTQRGTFSYDSSTPSPRSLSQKICGLRCTANSWIRKQTSANTSANRVLFGRECNLRRTQVAGSHGTQCGGKEALIEGDKLFRGTRQKWYVLIKFFYSSSNPSCCRKICGGSRLIFASQAVGFDLLHETTNLLHRSYYDNGSRSYIQECIVSKKLH